MMKTPVWVVTNVQPQKDYTLILTFASGEKKLFDARPLLAKAIYKPLNNLSFFLTAKADCGSVAWSDEIDINKRTRVINKRKGNVKCSVPKSHENSSNPHNSVTHFFPAVSLTIK